MSYYCYAKWVHSVGHGIAREMALNMGVTVAQIQLWNNRMQKGAE